MNIHVTILEHEHGSDVSAYRLEIDALRGAMSAMRSTLDELRKQIAETSGDVPLAGERLEWLDILTRLHAPSPEDVEGAILIYEALYEDAFPESDRHFMTIKTVLLK